MFNILDETGADPVIDPLTNTLQTRKSIVLPLQEKTWNKMPIAAKQDRDALIRFGNSLNINSQLSLKELARQKTALNKGATELFSNYGKKIIKYNNRETIEGGGGLAYAITDPKIFYIPQRYNYPKIINNLKYSTITYDNME